MNNMTNIVPLQPKRLPERFYIDLAIGAAPVEDICATYGLDPDAVKELAGDAEFDTRFFQAKQSVEDDGRAFRARCRAAVHRAVPTMEQIVNDDEAPANVRVEAFKALVKFGQLEPKETQAQGGGAHLTLTIVAPDGARTEARVGNVIEHQPDPNDDLAAGYDEAWDD